jgi:endogenous inhibitor of DNA gyrase (YacG/DUF329 family)
MSRFTHASGGGDPHPGFPSGQPVAEKGTPGALTASRVVLGEATGTIEAVRGKVADVLWDTGARSPVPVAWLSGAPTCAECGGAMEAERSTRTFCSNRCRLRAWRRNAKARGTHAMAEGDDARETSPGNVREAA